jgi:hypothetical protein
MELYYCIIAGPASVMLQRIHVVVFHGFFYCLMLHAIRRIVTFCRNMSLMLQWWGYIVTFPDIHFALVRIFSTIFHNVTMNPQNHIQRDSYKFRTIIPTRLITVFIRACKVRGLWTTCEANDVCICTVVTFVWHYHYVELTDCTLVNTHHIINTSIMLQVVSEGYPYVTMCCNIHI